MEVSRRRQQRQARQAQLTASRRGAVDEESVGGLADRRASRRAPAGAERAREGGGGGRHEARAARQSALGSQPQQRLPGRTPPRSQSPQPPAPARAAWGAPPPVHVPARVAPPYTGDASYGVAPGGDGGRYISRKEARRARQAALGLPQRGGGGRASPMRPAQQRGAPAQAAAPAGGEWAAPPERGGYGETQDRRMDRVDRLQPAPYHPDARATGPDSPTRSLSPGVSPEESSRVAALEAELAAMKAAQVAALESEVAAMKAEQASGGEPIDRTDDRQAGAAAQHYRAGEENVVQQVQHAPLKLQPEPEPEPEPQARTNQQLIQELLEAEETLRADRERLGELEAQVDAAKVAQAEKAAAAASELADAKMELGFAVEAGEVETKGGSDTAAADVEAAKLKLLEATKLGEQTVAAARQENEELLKGVNEELDKMTDSSFRQKLMEYDEKLKEEDAGVEQALRKDRELMQEAELRLAHARGRAQESAEGYQSELEEAQTELLRVQAQAEATLTQAEMDGLRRMADTEQKGQRAIEVAICIKIDEFCIKDDELCTKNDEFCTTNDELNTNAQEEEEKALLKVRSQ